MTVNTAEMRAIAYWHINNYPEDSKVITAAAQELDRIRQDFAATIADASQMRAAIHKHIEKCAFCAGKGFYNDGYYCAPHTRVCEDCKGLREALGLGVTL